MKIFAVIILSALVSINFAFAQSQIITTGNNVVNTAVPEQEVIKNGVNLGEMNKLLMKKVEELTLYLIEKDKKEKEQEYQLKEEKLNDYATMLQKQKVELDKIKEQLDKLLDKKTN